jgi:hypothetical protein
VGVDVVMSVADGEGVEVEVERVVGVEEGMGDEVGVRRGAFVEVGRIGVEVGVVVGEPHEAGRCSMRVRKTGLPGKW